MLRILVVPPTDDDSCKDAELGENYEHIQRTFVEDGVHLQIVEHQLFEYVNNLDGLKKNLAQLCGQYHRVILHECCLENRIDKQEFLTSLLWLLNDKQSSDACDPVAVVIVGNKAKEVQAPRGMASLHDHNVCYLIPEHSLENAISHCTVRLAEITIIPEQSMEYKSRLVLYNGYLYEKAEHIVAEKVKSSNVVRVIKGLWLGAVALAATGTHSQTSQTPLPPPPPGPPLPPF